jgi:hypothetical protein
MVLIVGAAIGPFLCCSIVGRRSSRSTSFVLRWSSAMPVGRALHVELSSAPTRDGRYRRNGSVCSPRFSGSACLGSWLRCAPGHVPGPDQALCSGP